MLKNQFINKIKAQTNQIEELQKTNNELFLLSQNLLKNVLNYENILNDSTNIQKKIELYSNKT